MFSSTIERRKMDEKLQSEVDGYGSCNALVPSEKEAPKKWTTLEWLALSTLALVNFCTGACVSLQAPFFPQEAENKGVSATEYGLIFGVYQLTIFVTSPIIGWLVVYISPTYLLNFGIIIVGTATVLFGTLNMVDDYRTFVSLAFLVRIVEGFGSACSRTASSTITASMFPDKLARTYSILQTFIGVGIIIGPTLGGVLYDVGGYGLPFYVTGAFMLVDAVIIIFVLPKTEMKARPPKSNLRRFWLHPTTAMYSLSVFTSFNYIGFNAVTLEPHVRGFHLSGFLLGTIFVISGIVYAVTAPCYGWLLDKGCDSKYVSLFGCLLVVASVIIIGPAPFFPFDEKLWLIIPALAIYGLSCGAKIVSAFTGMFKSTKSRGFPADISTCGLVSAMINSSQSLGAFVGPTVGGVLLDAFGYRNASMSLLVLEGIVILLLITSILRDKLSRTSYAVTLKEQPTKSVAAIFEKNYPNGIIKNTESKDTSY